MASPKGDFGRIARRSVFFQPRQILFFDKNFKGRAGVFFLAWQGFTQAKALLDFCLELPSFAQRPMKKPNHPTTTVKNIYPPDVLKGLLTLRTSPEPRMLLDAPRGIALFAPTP